MFFLLSYFCKMFTKEEKKKFKTDFWTSFGIYMRKHNAKLGRVSWVNYRTHIKDMYFRLDITTKDAIVSVDFQHKDDGIRSLFYEQLLELKTVLQSSIGDDWKWEEVSFNEFNQPVSKVYIVLENVSIYNKDDWQKTFRFYEEKMLGLHGFWIDFKEIFKNLED